MILFRIYVTTIVKSSNTTTAKKVFYNVILKCFQNHCHLLKSQKQTKAFFKVSRRSSLPCFELNYKFLERHKKPLSLATTRKQENPVNTAQKMASQSSTKQKRVRDNGGSARVDCHIYRRRNKYHQRQHGI